MDFAFNKLTVSGKDVSLTDRRWHYIVNRHIIVEGLQLVRDMLTVSEQTV